MILSAICDDSLDLTIVIPILIPVEWKKKY